MIEIVTYHDRGQRAESGLTNPKIAPEKDDVRITAPVIKSGQPPDVLEIRPRSCLVVQVLPRNHLWIN
jgi:hypothetical protein